MAASAIFFYDGNSASATLHNRIRPSDEHHDFLQTKWKQLADFLISRFSADHDCASYTWIQGSYKYGTLIRPLEARQDYDVDLGFYAELPEEALQKADKARALKQSVREALIAYRFEDHDVSEVANPKERCERIRYEQQRFHIDVPCYRIEQKSDRRDLATENHGWETSDPKRLYTWFKANADGAGRIRRQICYLKMWAALEYRSEAGKPSSIMLTVLVSEVFNALRNADRSLPDDEIFQLISTKLLSRLMANAAVPNPVNNSENLNRLSNDEMQHLISRLRTLKDICDRAVAETDPEKSTILWSIAFRHYMPIGAPSGIREAMKAVFASPQPQINIAVYDKATDGRRIAQYSNAVPAVSKKRVLRFNVINAHQFPGASYEWTVRNSGREAGEANDLGHLATSNGPENTETTAYAGTHFLDCAVRRDGKVVAFRRVPVTVSGA